MADRSIHRRGLAPFDFYPYNPSDVAGWIFVALFAISTVIHLGLIVRYRSWFFIPFLMGCLAETGGYYGRAWAHDNRRLSSPYILQLFLIILATPLLSASIYMALPRLTRSLTSGKFRMRRVSGLYIVIDIACLVLQIAGTVMQAYGKGATRQNASHYIAGGLIFQLIAFGVFIVLAWIKHVQIKREPMNPLGDSRPPRWTLCFWALYISSTLILIRNLVRVVEFLQGPDGTILSHEFYLYVFDAVPMLGIVIIMAGMHPGQVVRRAEKIAKGIAKAKSSPANKEGATVRPLWV